MKTKFINSKALTFFLLFFIAVTAIAQKNKPEDVTIQAHLSGTAFVTADIEASIKFYIDFLGFKERKRINIDTPNGKAVFGATGKDPLIYVALVPAAFSKENPNFPGLNFIEIKDSKPSPFALDGKRGPIAGEIVMAYAVKGLGEIEKRMRTAGVQVVTPIALSATGRSKTLAVIDPNGVRIQMYEYVNK